MQQTRNQLSRILLLIGTVTFGEAVLKAEKSSRPYLFYPLILFLLEVYYSL